MLTNEELNKLKQALATRHMTDECWYLLSLLLAEKELANRQREANSALPWRG